jgi:hypothetical protein
LEPYTYHEAAPSANLPFDFKPSLFHDSNHIRLQCPTGWRWFYARNQKSRNVEASLYLNVNDGAASSAPRSPFGTIESSPRFPPQYLFDFVGFVEERLRRKKVERLVIKTPPQEYNLDRSTVLQPILFNKGYSVVDAEIGSVLNIKGEFIDGLNRLEKRKLKSSAAAGITCKQVPLSKLDKVYGFILACRSAKGYELSMTLKALQDSVTQFSSNYLLFGAFAEQELVGAVIAVRITKTLLYVFYADHDARYDRWSPVVALMGSLHDYCRSHRIATLDLGTSAVSGRPNFGLLAFKARLGAQPTMKLTFQKKLHS